MDDDNRFIKICLAIIVLFIVGVVLKMARSVLFPFFLAVLLSYVINPILEWMTARKIPRPVAVILLLLATFSIVYLLGLLFYESGKAFAESLPDYAKRLTVLMDNLQARMGRLPVRNINITSFLNSLNPQRIGAFLLASLGTFLGFFETMFVVFVFLAFILAGRGSIQRKVESAFPSDRAIQLTSVLCSIEKQIQRYLAIKTLFSLTNAVIVYVVLTLFGMKFAIVHAFIAFLTNYIPNIGGYIATVIRVSFAFFQFGSLWKPLEILVLTVGIDSTMATVLEPRLMGRGLGLSPVVVLFALFFGAWLWGIPGMIMAVPAVAVIRIIADNVPSLGILEVLLGK